MTKSVGVFRAGSRQAFWLATAMASASLAAGFSGAPAWAQQAARSFDIPAQSLADGLTQFGQQSGWQVSVRGDLIAGAVTHGVKGAMTPEQALRELTAGSGFTYALSEGNVVTLRKVAEVPVAPVTPGATRLGVVQVDDTGMGSSVQDPVGPGIGYIATRSTTGSKTDTPVIEVPQSISTVTRQQIEDQRPEDLNAALRYTPGVIAESEGPESGFWVNQGSILLRGFSAEVYMDGLQNDGDNLHDPYLFDRIEVIGGPDSVMGGGASPGGVVNEVSKRPTDEPLHEIRLGVGDRDRYEGAFDFSGRLDDDGKLLYRLTGVGMSENTQMDFVKHQRLSIAPAFTWRPDSDTSLTILTSYTWNPAIGDYAYVPAQGTALPNPGGKISTSFNMGDPSWNEASQKIWNIGYQAQHKFNDVFSVEQNFRIADDSNTAEMVWPLGLEDDLRTLDRYTFFRQVDFKSVLVDTRGKLELESGPVKSTTLFGFDYKRYDEYWRWGSNTDIPSIDIFAPVYGQTLAGPTSFDTEHYLSNQYGAYVQEQLSIDHLRLMLSGRQDWVRATDEESSAPDDPTRISSQKFTWRAGAVYLFDNGLAPYASYATSFQPQEGSTYSGEPYVPTTGAQYEIGLKYQPPGVDAFITGALYNLTQQNVLVTDPDHPGFSEQEGEIRSRGIELQAHANLFDDLKLLATYTYTDAETTKSTVSDTGIDGVTSAVQGKQVYSIPHDMASIWADYALPAKLGTGLGIGAGARYVGSSYGDDVNSFKVPSYFLVDAVLHYDLGALGNRFSGAKLQLNASNLLDKTYVASCFSGTGCYFGLRRTVKATLTYDW